MEDNIIFSSEVPTGEINRCTCWFTHNFKWSGCQECGIPDKFITVKEIVEIKERIKVLERIVTALLVDDEFKEKAKKAAKEMGITNVQS